MVLQSADASARQQHLRGQGWCSGDGQSQLWEGRGAAPAGAVQQYPLVERQQPGGGVLFSAAFDKAHSAGREASCSLVGVNVEEALACIRALEDADPALDGAVSLPLATPVVSRRADEGLLEIRRDQAHLQQWRSSESAHGQPAFGAVPPENGTKGRLGPCSFATTHTLNQYPLHHQQLQNHYGNVMATYPAANEQQTHGRIIGIDEGNYHIARSSGLGMDGSGNGAKAASNYCSGGLSFGGDWGAGISGGGQIKSGSPKSSISSDGSGGNVVGNSPAAVWEVDLRRGASKGGGEGGGGGGSGGEGRKRALDAAGEDVAGLWQPQMVRSSPESSVSLPDTEQGMDAIKQLFLCANMELESSLAGDEAEIRKKDEKVKQLLQLLRVTSLERDEARDQLQRLLGKISQATPLEQSPTQLQPDLLSTARARCNLDIPSRTHTYQPFASSLLDAVFPPEVPHKIMTGPSIATMAPQQAPLPECASTMPPAAAAEFDPASAIIDCLVVKRALPEKGKLLQAVMEAGPLLQTLLVAGSLPRWRNPPPLEPFQIPPVSVRSRESSILNQNEVLNQNYLIQSSLRAFHHQNSLVASQIYSASSLGSSDLSPFVLLYPAPATCAGSYQGPAGKRQKF